MKKNVLTLLLSLTLFSFDTKGNKKYVKDLPGCYYLFGIAYDAITEERNYCLSLPICVDEYNSILAETYFIEAVKFWHLGKIETGKPILHHFFFAKDADIAWEKSKQIWEETAAKSGKKLHLVQLPKSGMEYENMVRKNMEFEDEILKNQIEQRKMEQQQFYTELRERERKSNSTLWMTLGVIALTLATYLSVK